MRYLLIALLLLITLECFSQTATLDRNAYWTKNIKTGLITIKSPELDLMLTIELQSTEKNFKKVLYRKKVETISREEYFNLDVQSFPTGNYIVVVYWGKEYQVTIPFIVIQNF